ncbi:alcohol dehydrogenase catalytic domain-containing protein [Sinorhizobium medicae]|uniref:alcohol dehydrogenase catalytic domain-containing protein n=1 Tax=Sinorhizobium medicae TaxID=110321 RepID=UPI0012952F58|nr:alcohol dehydrogenase catalytic domain-containing protein [Sinorhizobium medicae]MQX48987.1 alcohol dehydrogenase catalytic domain-containing protein [Sinorhizobium medicae]
MKAWVHHQTGGPDVLRLEERPRPKPGRGEVLVRNRAVGLNPVDWKFIEWGHAAWEWPHIPGVDGAGEIAEAGEGVTHVGLGARVAYHNDLARPGSFAEYTVVPARAVIALPGALPFAAAAAIPCPALTAFQAVSKPPLAAGAHVLVTGASGAVGGALLQLARKRGWIVHAVCSAAQFERVIRLGAATVTDYHRPDWRSDIQDMARLQPLQAVFDMVSGEHASSLAHLLTANGHLVCIQDRQEKAPLPAFTTTISLHEVGLNAMHGYADDGQWGRLVAAGAAIAADIVRKSFDPQVMDVVAFDALPEALARLKAGPNPGNRVALF